MPNMHSENRDQLKSSKHSKTLISQAGKTEQREVTRVPLRKVFVSDEAR